MGRRMRKIVLKSEEIDENKNKGEKIQKNGRNRTECKKEMG